MNDVLSADISTAQFALLCEEEIKKVAVCEIQTDVVWQGRLPRPFGLHDPRMGPLQKFDKCSTCGMGQDCPGHMGYINLSVPLLSQPLIPSLLKILKMSCLFCSRIRADEVKKGKVITLLQDPSIGMIGKDTNLLESWDTTRDELIKDLCITSQCKNCGRSYSGLQWKRQPGTQAGIVAVWKPDNITSPPVRPSTFTHIQHAVAILNARRDPTMSSEEKEKFIAETERDLVPSDEVIASRKNEDMIGTTRRKNARGHSEVAMLLQAVHLKHLVCKIFENPQDEPVLRRLWPMCFAGPHPQLGGAFFVDTVPVTANIFRPLMHSDLGGKGSSSSPINKDEGPGGMLHPKTKSLQRLIERSKACQNDILQTKSDLSQLVKKQSGKINRTQLQLIQPLNAEEAMQFATHCQDMQADFNAMLDSNTAIKNRDGTSNAFGVSVRQWMEKKQGAIRQKMMGKRVNYAARTVIAPDAYINTNEIGVPIEFAKKLSIPEPVTNFNQKYLRALVVNGEDVYPGASSVKDSRGRVVNLKHLSLDKRRALASSIEPLSTAGNTEGMFNPIVYRNMRDGDSVVMNRQPSLHKPSMMCHYIRVLKGWKTFRLHYVNCGSYNADFDGDEMNMHCPQSTLSRTECRIVGNADCQYNVPKDGGVLRGLIQDHVLGGNYLTRRGATVDKDLYMQLCYASMASFVDRMKTIKIRRNRHDEADIKMKSSINKQDSFDPADIISEDYYGAYFNKENVQIHVEPPAILKPQVLWTGKQVISGILKTVLNYSTERIYKNKLSEKNRNNEDPPHHFKGINLISKSKTAGDSWNGACDGDKEEETVIIRNSELLQGVLDKNQFGASTFGLVNYVYELLGPTVTGTLLGIFGRLFTNYMQHNGFSCNAGSFQMIDIGERKRQQLVDKCIGAGTFLQEYFIDDLLSQTNWKDPNNDVDNDLLTHNNQNDNHTTELHSDYSSQFKGNLRKALQRNTLKKMQKEDENFDKKVQLHKDGKCSDVKLKVNAIDKVRFLRSSENPIRDWRSLTAKDTKSMAEQCLNLIRTVARSKDISAKREMILQLAAMPDVMRHYPTFHQILDGKSLLTIDQYDHKRLHRNPQISKERITAFAASANRQVTSSAGSVLNGECSKLAPVTYPISWLYPDSYDFDDPWRYVNTLVKARNLDEVSRLKEADKSKPFQLTPNETTRSRLEALAVAYFGGRERVLHKMFDSFFQSCIGRITSANSDLVQPNITLYKFPFNGFASMILTGAKGSKVNYAMISGMLSQQSLEGRRVPVMVSFKTLPSFAKYDWGSRAGGLITDRYLTGLRPQEYFFHCMAGREGLVDTSVKTANSGYIQRCVMKGLEGMVVHYDGSVRDSDGSIVQFIYGEDGIDPARSAYLSSSKGLNNLLLTEDLALMKHSTENIDIRRTVKSQVDLFKKNGGQQNDNQIWSPTLTPGLVSPKYFQMVEEILAAREKTLKRSGQSKKEVKRRLENIRMACYLKYRDCVMQPGESVGCLGAQSIGEPATQMTLNTFHLAGHGAANVTLGIPRLREILQVAGYAKTPVIYIPLKQDKPLTELTVKEAMDGENIPSDIEDEIAKGDTDFKWGMKQKIRTVLNGFRRIPLTDVVHAVGVESATYLQPSPSVYGTSHLYPDNTGARPMKQTWMDGSIKNFVGISQLGAEPINWNNAPMRSDIDEISARHKKDKKSSYEPYWVYDVTFQLENLDHFEKVTGGSFSPEKIINLIVGKVAREWMRVVGKIMALNQLKSCHRRESQNPALTTLKDRARSAGLGYGTCGAFGQSGIADINEFMKGNFSNIENEILTAVEHVQMEPKKKGTLIDFNDDINNEEDHHRNDKGDAGMAEDGGAPSDLEDSSSEHSFSDSDAEIKDKPESMSDDNNQNSNYEETIAAEVKKEDADNDYNSIHIKEDKDTLQIKKEKKDIDHKKTLVKDGKLLNKKDKTGKLGKKQSAISSSNSIVMDSNPLSPSAVDKNSIWTGNKSIKLNQLPLNMFRALVDVFVCRETWTVTFRLALPKARYPRRLVLLPHIIKVIKKQMLQDTEGVKTPRIVGGESTNSKPKTRKCLI